MGALPVVKGLASRATKIDSCGKPIEGAGNRIVTAGFISFKLTPVTKDAQDIEQTNAEGKVCIKDRTPPERKWYDVELTLCGVDPEYISLLTGEPVILDYDGNVIGIADKSAVDADYGAAIEIWAGGSTDDDCPVPSDDSVFSQSGPGKHYGYILVGATEWMRTGDFTVEAGSANTTLRGRSIAIPRWGRGPYNVAAINSDLDAGRLLVPLDNDRHFTFFRTPIVPPLPTDGACELAVQSIFSSDYFAGGGVDVAPDQPLCNGVTYTVTITGSPTGGNITLTLGGKTTATIAYNAAASAVKSALVALDDGYGTADFTVTGSNGGPFTVVYPAGLGALTGTAALTGGTDPAVTVAVA